MYDSGGCSESDQQKRSGTQACKFTAQNSRGLVRLSSHVTGSIDIVADMGISYVFSMTATPGIQVFIHFQQ